MMPRSAAVDEWRGVDGVRMLEYFDAPSLRLLDEPHGAAVLVEVENGDVDALARSDRGPSNPGSPRRPRSRALPPVPPPLPELVNDTVRRNGFMKLGSDYAVPVARNREMLADLSPGAGSGNSPAAT